MNEKELRELDAWIAEHVMGWKYLTSGSFPDNDIAGVPPTTSGLHHPVPHYTTDPAAAVMVLEKCVSELCEQDNEETVSIGMEVPYFVVEKTNCSPSARVEASALPLAICLFAKKLFSK